MPNFSCDLSARAEPFPHFWEKIIGSGHAPLALRADWQRQLVRCRDELGIQGTRFHGILSSPMDTLICEENQLLYSFFNADQITDFLCENSFTPWIELSFMPETLASGDTRVFHYHANVTPPADFKSWNTLIDKLAHHWLARYGAENVHKWHFEVWNEPNESGFWTGTQEQYFELYRQTVTTLKNVDERLKIGGPVTSKNAWIPEFLDYCDAHELPVDFVSTHQYPTDSFGKPGDNTLQQLAASHRDALLDEVKIARDQSRGKALFYTEWNSSSNPRDDLHDQPYAAAFDAKTVLGMHGLVEAYSIWTFSDIFQENYMPSRPFHGGFGLLNLYNIPKPSYRAFQLMHRLGDELLPVEGKHETVDVWAVRGGDAVILFCTNHALPRREIKSEKVKFKVQTSRPVRGAWIERIDDDHANAPRFWSEQLGGPDYLSPRQKELLEAASQVVPQPMAWKAHKGAVEVEFELPAHGVAAITLDFGDPFPSAQQAGIED